MGKDGYIDVTVGLDCDKTTDEDGDEAEDENEAKKSGCWLIFLGFVALLSMLVGGVIAWKRSGKTSLTTDIQDQKPVQSDVVPAADIAKLKMTVFSEKQGDTSL